MTRLTPNLVATQLALVVSLSVVAAAEAFRPGTPASLPVSKHGNTDIQPVSKTGADILFAPEAAKLASKNDPDWEEDPPSSSTGQVETKDGKTVLKLGVEHSSTLSPIPARLHAGNIYNDKLSSGDSDKLSWYRIPNWLAGQWKRTQETTVFSQDYTSGHTDRETRSFMSEQTADFGVQKDKTGQVWNCNLSSKGISDRGSYRSIARVMFKEPVETGKKEIIFREVFTVVHVVKESNLIIDSFQVESLTRHRQLSDGSLETSMSATVYNAGGTPRQLQENIANDRRIAPMTVVDQYKGRDIKSNFTDFLKEQGLTNLIP